LNTARGRRLTSGSIGFPSKLENLNTWRWFFLSTEPSGHGL